MIFGRISTPHLLRAPGKPAGRALLRVTLLAACVIALPQQALAVSGLYGQVGLGYGKLSGSNLITNKLPGVDGDVPDHSSAGCCPSGGLAAQLRLGFSIFGFIGPEFGIVGHGWDLGSGSGGAGFVGGGLRLYPIHFLTLGGLDDKDFPIDISIGGIFGWSILGKDFAYTGSFLDFDLHVAYDVTEFFSIGVKLDIVLPTYSDFVYTDYKNNLGRCLDSAGEQIGTDGRRVDPATENTGRITKNMASCNGKGPSASFISPQIVATFHFDPFE